jgi:hypothetical protein
MKARKERLVHHRPIPLVVVVLLRSWRSSPSTLTTTFASIPSRSQPESPTRPLNIPDGLHIMTRMLHYLSLLAWQSCTGSVVVHRFCAAWRSIPAARRKIASESSVTSRSSHAAPHRLCGGKAPAPDGCGMIQRCKVANRNAFGFGARRQKMVLELPPWVELLCRGLVTARVRTTPSPPWTSRHVRL